jgi:hypothetical protein
VRERVREREREREKVRKGKGVIKLKKGIRTRDGRKKLERRA